MRRILVTGAGGYIGSTVVEAALRAGYDVTALDRFYFGQEILKDFADNPDLHVIKKDIRDVTPKDFEGFYAVIDLAALSNDPAGELDPALTRAINCVGRIGVAQAAKAAGVPRYTMASSCSVYGFSESSLLTETSPLAPQTEYARSMREAEAAALKLNDATFCVTPLRLATVFGLSRRMRFDLVVNTMTRSAADKGALTITGGGLQWRPLVHVRDVARAFLHVLDQPREVVGGEVFNIGIANYQMNALANEVRDAIPDPIMLETVPGTNDTRSYNVSFDKAKKVIGYTAQITIAEGAREIYDAIKKGKADTSGKTVTVNWYKYLLEAERLIDTLRINGRLL